MNPEEKFEQALARDIAAAARHDPTAAWKADILAHALATPKTKAKLITFPRLMLGAWAACWAVALTLQFLTPGSSTKSGASSGKSLPMTLADWRTLQNQRATMLSLLASNDSPNFPHR